MTKHCPAEAAKSGLQGPPFLRTVTGHRSPSSPSVMDPEVSHTARARPNTPAASVESDRCGDRSEPVRVEHAPAPALFLLETAVVCVFFVGARQLQAMKEDLGDDHPSRSHPPMNFVHTPRRREMSPKFGRMTHGPFPTVPCFTS